MHSNKLILKKAIISTLKQDTHTENQKFFHLKKSDKKRQELDTEVFDLLSICVFLFFLNKQRESKTDLKH